ncbi:MAG: T9SS type A sorting domain-containing protein, partial [Ignavibacteria bacterium]
SAVCPTVADTQGRLLTNTPPMNAGTVGANFFGNYYYNNRWNGTDLYVVSRTGTIVRTMIYTGSCRDLTWRGDGFLYGGKATSTMWKIDTLTGASTIFFTGSANIRACAWDPNRKVFWVSDFGGNIFAFDTTGAAAGTLSIGNTWTAKYGMAFDSCSAGSAQGAYLWVWVQPKTLYRVRIATNLVVETCSMTAFGIAASIAGGAEITTDFVTGTGTLFLNFQNDVIIGFKICDLPVGIGNNENQIPSAYRLEQNYPNPFNPTTTITYALPKFSAVEIIVFDMAGRIVKTLVSEIKQAGTYSVDFDASELSSGVYFYKMNANDFTDTRKILVVN